MLSDHHVGKEKKVIKGMGVMEVVRRKLPRGPELSL